MTRIGILEVSNITHGLDDRCRMFNDRWNMVTVFTSREISDQVKQGLNPGEYEWVIKRENQTVYSFLKDVERICNERIDLLYVNTRTRVTPFLFFNPKCRKILRIHNTNWWFRRRQSLKRYYQDATGEGRPGCSGVLEYMDPLVNALAGPLARKVILRRYDGISVEYRPIKEYIAENFCYRKGIYIIPTLLYQGAPAAVNHDKIRFMVPGDISKQRRDYLTVFGVFRELFAGHSSEIELHILGRSHGTYGNDVLHICRMMKAEGCPVYYNEGGEYVSEAEFRAIMDGSDVIICPLNLDFYEKGVRERYSQTKGTGVISDAIRHARPLMVPSGFHVAEEFRTSIITYAEAEDLKRELVILIQNPDELERLKSEALANSEKFSLDRMREYCSRMISEVLGG